MRSDGAEDHALGQMTVAAPRRKHGHSPIHPPGELGGDFIRRGGDDDHQLAVVAGQSEHDRVDQLGRGKDGDHGIQGVLQTAVDDRRQRDDDRVGQQHDAPDAEIRQPMVQITGDDIGTARTAAAQEDQSESDAR